MILFGERSLKSATAQFVSHYLKERNHQGLEIGLENLRMMASGIVLEESAATAVGPIEDLRRPVPDG
jgi:hypothetical protein